MLIDLHTGVSCLRQTCGRLKFRVRTTQGMISPAEADAEVDTCWAAGVRS